MLPSTLPCCYLKSPTETHDSNLCSLIPRVMERMHCRYISLCYVTISLCYVRITLNSIGNFCAPSLGHSVTYGRIPVCYKVMYGVVHLVRDDCMMASEVLRFSVLSE